MPRVEQDSLGTKELPDKVYYGIQTARAVENFMVSGLKESPELIHAYAAVKKAAALANMELKLLKEELGNAIVAAASEVISGSLDDQFVVDVFQAGAGTSFNMNVNEVIANRALELLARPRGDYGFLSPNDHVNMGQSSNDTFPTACHIAVVSAAGTLLAELSSLADSLRKKGRQFEGAAKSGRTHLTDAMPVTLGAEIKAWASAVERAEERIGQRREDLRELPIGGTAVGTGTNAHPDFRKKVLARLSELCDEEYRPAKDSYEALQSRAQLAAFSSSLRELAQELIRIADDIRLLGSGPSSGIGEIKLQAVQPGSSAMPGKVNPVMAECLNMVCFQVIGNDLAVSLATQAGQLELNVMTPVMVHNIMSSISMLNRFLPVFRERCVDRIEADRARCQELLERNPAMATLLVPRIGYLKAAELAKRAQERGISVKDLVVEAGVLSEEEAAELLDPEKAAQGLYD
jgi:aspartate ammonia-lyase